mgnify:CR=1 FL=1
MAVSLSWILLSVTGALPLFLSGEFATYTDALFETISGLTTTGASILSPGRPHDEMPPEAKRNRPVYLW